MTNKIKYLILLTTVLMVAMVVLLINIFSWQNKYRHEVCSKNLTVQEIVSLNGRSAIILLSDGEKVSVTNMRVKKGDSYCGLYGINDK
jgi:hypothetical protein